MVSSSVVAEQLGISRRTVTRLATSGVLTAAKDDRGHFTFDLETALAEYEAYNTAGDDEGVDWNVENKKADTRNKTIKGDMLQLELDEMRGKYHRSEFVEDAINDLVFAVRSHLSALPGKLGPELAEVADTAACVEAVKRECNAVLADLARYRYNPGVFRQRLHDAGVRTVSGDERDDA